MKITMQLEKGLENVIGKPVVIGKDSTNVFGEVIEYNPETGEATIEMNEEKLKTIEWIPIAGKNIASLSNRKEF